MSLTITIDKQRFRFAQNDDGEWETDIDPTVARTLRAFGDDKLDFAERSDMENRVEALLWGLNIGLIEPDQLSRMNKLLASPDQRLNKCPLDVQFPVFVLSTRMGSERADRWLIQGKPDPGQSFLVFEFLGRLGHQIYEQYYETGKMRAVGEVMKFVAERTDDADGATAIRCSILMLALHSTPEVMWRDELPCFTSEEMSEMGLLWSFDWMVREPCSDDHCEVRHRNLSILYSLWVKCREKIDLRDNNKVLRYNTSYVTDLRHLMEKTVDKEYVAVCRLFDYLPPEACHNIDYEFMEIGFGARSDSPYYDGPKELAGYLCMLCRRVIEVACTSVNQLKESCESDYCPIHVPLWESEMGNRGVRLIRVGKNGPIDKLPVGANAVRWHNSKKWSIRYSPERLRTSHMTHVLNLVVQSIDGTPVDATYTSDKGGNLWLVGDGDGDALRNGNGSGHAIRLGGGHGTARRETDSKYDGKQVCGHAIRLGSGDGSAVVQYNVVNTIHHVHLQRSIHLQNSNLIVGSAYRDGDGIGDAYVEGSVGFAVKTGDGDGFAVCCSPEHQPSLPPCRFGAHRSGGGNGDAEIVGHDDDELRCGVAKRSGSGQGEAVSRIIGSDDDRTETRDEETVGELPFPKSWNYRSLRDAV